eukprot:s1559_g16.t1
MPGKVWAAAWSVVCCISPFYIAALSCADESQSCIMNDTSGLVQVHQIKVESKIRNHPPSDLKGRYHGWRSRRFFFGHRRKSTTSTTTTKDTMGASAASTKDTKAVVPMESMESTESIEPAGPTGPGPAEVPAVPRESSGPSCGRKKSLPCGSAVAVQDTKAKGQTLPVTLEFCVEHPCCVHDHEGQEVRNLFLDIPIQTQEGGVPLQAILTHPSGQSVNLTLEGGAVPTLFKTTSDSVAFAGLPADGIWTAQVVGPAGYAVADMLFGPTLTVKIEFC